MPVPIQGCSFRMRRESLETLILVPAAGSFAALFRFRASTIRCDASVLMSQKASETVITTPAAATASKERRDPLGTNCQAMPAAMRISQQRESRPPRDPEMNTETTGIRTRNPRRKRNDKPTRRVAA